MLTKIYIDNFRSLVDFEFRPGPTQLILGDNGSGKSSLFEALELVRQVVVDGISVSFPFRRSTLTRWESRTRQTFELSVDGNGGQYAYHLEIEQSDGSRATRIGLETLDFDGKSLLEFSAGTVRVFNDDNNLKNQYDLGEHRSGLYVVPPRDDVSKIAWFKGWMEDLCCVALDPVIDPAIDSGFLPDRPDSRFNNFASWFKNVQHEDPASIAALFDVLRSGVIDGFEAMSLAPIGRDTEELRVALKSGCDRPGPSSNQFDARELSEGQRTLIKLYALALCVMKPGRTIFLDDPVVHVSLSEVQPWLLYLLDRSDDIDSQVILSSHHPELINYLARKKGVFFRRDGNGPVRVIAAPIDEESRLGPSELIARGWVDG